MSKRKTGSRELANTAVEAILEKKGSDVKVFDLRKLTTSVSDFFVLCTATSTPQMEAIMDSVDEFVKKQHGEDAFHIEGRENAEWILMDYVDMVVHIFKPEARDFYQLDQLWSDADIKTIEN